MADSWLLQRMTDWGETRAIVWRDEATSFRALLNLVSVWKKRVSDLEIKRGEVVTFEGDYSPDSVALFLALMDSTAVIVPLSDAVAAEREEFVNIAEVQVLISLGPKGQWHAQRREVIVQNPLTSRLQALGEPGLVLFSSGSTGRSKAALHNLDTLMEKFRQPRPGMSTITFLLLDHIGGINTLFYVLANGGTAVTVERRDPATVCKAIQDHRVELLPTSPTFLNLLLMSEAYVHYDLSSLKKITYGTEVMPETTLTRLCEILPGVTLQQTYGLSELGILRSKSRDSDSLWVKVGGEGMETKIVDGILWVRSKFAMMGYLNSPSPFDADGWMITGDKVETDGEYIRIMGRETEIINVGGRKVYPSEVENIVMQMDNVRDVVVYGEKNPIMGSIVAARISLIEPESVADLKRRLRSFCKEKLAPYKVPARVEITSREQFSGRFKKMRQYADE